jgi:hypothetical protein
MAKVARLPAILAVAVIRGYQLSIGRVIGGRCRFHPSCSDYAAEAIRSRGVVIGSGLAAWRLLRCGPWSAGGIDPVPSRRPEGALDG